MARLTYKYKINPTKAQAARMARTLDTCRHVYNSLLNWRRQDYEALGKPPSKAQQQAAFPLWKKRHPELCDVYSQGLQNVAVRVDLTYQAFFRRVEAGQTPGYPRFKGDGYNSFTYPQSGFGFCEGRLRLSKIGDVPLVLHRPIIGTIKTCTLRRQSGKWFACFSVETEIQPLPKSEESIGIDVGLKVFAALSNGEMIENPRFFRRDEAALATAQRKQAKNRKRTKAYQRVRKVIARIHERIRNRRHDFVHQAARGIVNRFGVIAIEKLNVKNMTAAPKAKPDPENEGVFLPNGARCKVGLNKSILDASWSLFATLLTTKAESAGRLVVAVNRAYTSQACSGCGNIVKKTLAIRTHRCLSCGLVLDRDTNAAVNIMSAGLHKLATMIA